MRVLIKAQLARRAVRSTELDAVCLALGQGLFGAARDEIALDLGHQAENRRHDLGLQRIVKDNAVLGDMEVHAARDALLADLQHLERAARQARDLRHHDHITRSRALHQMPQWPRAPVGATAGRVFHEYRCQELFIGAVAHDTVSLVGDVLGVRGHPQIGENLIHGVRILQVSGINVQAYFL